MAESGGGSFGARLYSGLGALGNILRLSTGSQVVPSEETIEDGNDELVSVDEEVAITKEQQEDEIAQANVDSMLTDTQITEEEYDSIEYEGQLVTEMKNYELRSALKQEGIKVEARQTKKQCMDVLIKIAYMKAKNGIRSADDDNSEVSRAAAVRSTPSKHLTRAAAASSVSVSKMSTRRSAAASGPPSSNLRHRSPPPPVAASPILEKRKRTTRTPSAKVEAPVASRSEKKKSHISNDEYELSGTARKKRSVSAPAVSVPAVSAPAVSAPASAKKRSAPRAKQAPAEKKILPASAKKPTPIRTSAVGLDEIPVNSAYGKGSRNREDSEEEEDESISDMEQADSIPEVHTVISRADYLLSKAQADRDSELKTSIEMTADTEDVAEDSVQDMVVEEEVEPAVLESRNNRSYVTDTYNNGSEDESFMDSDFPGAVPCRDEDGAEADAEDEEEEEDDDEEEEDKVIVPYDQVAEGDDEHENTAEDDDEEEDEDDEEEDDNNNVSEEGEGDNEVVVPGVVDEYEEEGEGEGEGEGEDEEAVYEEGDEYEVPMSDDQSSEDADQDEQADSNPSPNRHQGGEVGVVDLVSSDDNDNHDNEERAEGTDDEDDGCGNDSFLTADTNDPAILKTSFLPKPVSQALLPVDKAVKTPDNPASIKDAVNTVLGALKGSLSSQDYQQLQQMMGRFPETATLPSLLEPGSAVDENVQLHRQASTSFSQAVDYSENILPKTISDKEKRLSGDGRSWTSRESFLPPSPHDRFAPVQPVVARSAAAPTQSPHGQLAMADLTQSYRGASTNTSGVRFEDSERKLSVGGTNNHIRYGPVTFMRRPMTPFARKPVSSPSPFKNPLYDTASSMPAQIQTQTQGSIVRQQLLTANLPFPSSEDQLRKRRYEDSSHNSNTDDREYSGAKRMNLGQARYSLGSYEQSRHDSTPIDDRNDMQARMGASVSMFENGSQDEKGYSQGSYQPGPRTLNSSYTPLYKDNNSRGVFSGVLLQGTQLQARRGSLSFAQRRKRQSEGGQGMSSVPSASGALKSSSAYASASVAKRILDTLGELQTPMEEARHRPIAVAAALSASADALSRSERAPVEPMRRPAPAVSARALDIPGPGPFTINFPVFPSVAQAAVAATTPSTATTTTAAATASSVRSSSQWQSTSSTTTPDAPPAKSPAQLFSFPTVAALPAALKTPKTSTVRFAEPDSEFTFVDPSEVEGVDQSEMEELLATPGKRNDRIKFTFSPPGKANKSAEKSRRSLGVTEPGSNGALGNPPVSTPTGSLNQAVPQGESLWSKAIATASNTQKCPTCFVQNTKIAPACVSCETVLQGTGQGAASAPAPVPVPVPVPRETAAPTVGFSFAPSIPVPVSTPAPVAPKAVTAAATEPAKSSLWAMAASSDLVKCQTCLVQNPKGSVKCVSCENSLVSSGAAPAPKSTFAAPTPSSSSAPFTFGAPVAPVTATAPQAVAASGFKTSTADPSPVVKPAPFTFGAPSAPVAAAATAAITMPSAATSFTGFSAPAVASTPAPMLFPAALSTATAPSSSGAGTFGSQSVIGEIKKPVGLSFGLPPSARATAPAVTSSPAPSSFTFGAAPSTTPSSTATPSITFGAPAAASLSVPTTTPVAAPAPFTFGSVPPASVPTPSSSLSVPAFTFGATAAAPSANAAPAPFMFGAPASKPEAATAGYTMPPFSFGSAAPAPSSGLPGALSTPAFSFGGSSAPAPFMFGAASASTPTATPSFPSNPIALGGASFGMDSPTSTMDTGYTSGDASNIAFPPAAMPLAFGGAPAPFSFGAPAPSIGAIGSQLAPFGTSSQSFNSSGPSFGLPSGNQPFVFGAAPQAQAQPAFGFGPGIASGFAQSQPAPFTFGQPPAGGFSAAPQGMGMGHSMADPVGGGGGFSMGATDTKGRRKLKGKRPGGGP